MKFLVIKAFCLIIKKKIKFIKAIIDSKIRMILMKNFKMIKLQIKLDKIEKILLFIKLKIKNKK